MTHILDVVLMPPLLFLLLRGLCLKLFGSDRARRAGEFLETPINEVFKKRVR